MISSLMLHSYKEGKLEWSTLACFSTLSRRLDVVNRHRSQIKILLQKVPRRIQQRGDQHRQEKLQRVSSHCDGEHVGK